MLEAPEVEPHLHHKTGHSLADKILAALAIFLSGVSVFIAVSHGRTMERLVAANSWPNIGYSTSNASDDGLRHDITLEVKNTGVGPARIDSVELFYDSAPQTSARSLLKACCGLEGSSSAGANVATSTVQDEVLPARDSIEFLRVPREAASAALWTKLNDERFKLRLRICYCSVFDECWARDSAQRRPERVSECRPTQPVQYR